MQEIRGRIETWSKEHNELGVIRTFLAPEVKLLLLDLLRSAKGYVEWGASDFAFQERNALFDVPFMVIDADPVALYNHRLKYFSSPIPKASLVSIYVDLGEVMAGGKPVDRSAVENFPEYSGHAFDRLEKEGVAADVFLINGQFRLACLLAILLKTRSNVVHIVLDHYVSRPAYQTLSKIIKPTKELTKAAYFSIDVTKLEKAELAKHYIKAVFDVR